MGNKLAAAPNETCPFLNNPFEYCFCARLGSQDIPKALKYCGGDFRKCEIYKKLQQINQ